MINMIYSGALSTQQSVLLDTAFPTLLLDCAYGWAWLVS